MGPRWNTFIFDEVYMSSVIGNVIKDDTFEHVTKADFMFWKIC